MTHFEDAFLLLTGRRPQNAKATLAPRAALTIGALLAALDLCQQWRQAGESPVFNMYGLNALAASIAVGFAVILLHAGGEAAEARRRNLILLWAGVTAIPLLLALALPRSGDIAPSLRANFAYAGLGVALMIFAATALGARQAFAVSGARRPALRGLGFALSLWGALAALPDWPAFSGENFKRREANIWEMAFAKPAPSEEEMQAWREKRRAAEDRVAAIEAAQPLRIESELEKIAPRASNKPNIFVVGVAGWSDQDVFKKEIEQSLDIIGARLGAEGRAVALINNDESADTHPIASVQNLSQVLRGVARKMNLEEDVLLLTMTSHGSKEGFALENGALVERTLSPQSLRAMLDEIGIRNRVVIVSSCYSGVFVPALADANTMVISAASATRTSFGCANDRGWTYFGDAFYAHGLREEPTLSQAFDKARDLIAKWEDQQHLTPSDPQIFIGDEIRQRFPALIGAGRSTIAASKKIRESRDWRRDLDIRKF
jgi:hypothetical protein